MARESMQNDICCPKFDPEPWDQQSFEWDEKRFIKDSVLTLFYMPLNIRGVMKRLDQKVRNAGGNMPDRLCLADHTSKWNMDVYLAVDREIPGAGNTTLSGDFVSKVYEGPYKDTGVWCKDFEEYTKHKGLAIRKWYMWYTTCPRCARKYEKNYVVILGRVEKG